ncbi:MAG: F0F1 ATP synthase subunit gamma [Maricaulaceae bacterium]|jgi:F-type H+-transporting ATPase subunit gamma
MEKLDRLRTRISTITSLAEIVRTMKTLSAVSIRQYERAAAALEAHRETISLGLHVALRDPRTRGSAFAAGRSLRGTRGAVIVFGSDRGLCGRFNELVADIAAHRIDRLEEVGADPLVLAVGARAAAALEARGRTPEEVFFLPGSAEGLSRTAQAILIKTDEWRAEHGISRVVVASNRRADRALARPSVRQILPLETDELEELAARPWRSRRLPEPALAHGELFAWLLRQHLFAEVFAAGAESLASEHATRLAAMQAAERHIDEHLAEMNAAYRRSRQSSITSELLDVIGGFEAVRRGRRTAHATPR